MYILYYYILFYIYILYFILYFIFYLYIHSLRKCGLSICLCVCLWVRACVLALSVCRTQWIYNFAPRLVQFVTSCRRVVVTSETLLLLLRTVGAASGRRLFPVAVTWSTGFSGARWTSVDVTREVIRWPIGQPIGDTTPTDTFSPSCRWDTDRVRGAGRRETSPSARRRIHRLQTTDGRNAGW